MRQQFPLEDEIQEDFEIALSFLINLKCALWVFLPMLFLLFFSDMNSASLK